MPSPSSAPQLTFAALTLLSLTPEAHAQDLRYRWVKGQTQRFEAAGTDPLAMSGMGMAIEARFETRARFALAIHRVDPSGLARGHVVLESFEVKDDQGRVVAGLESIPRGALRSPTTNPTRTPDTSSPASRTRTSMGDRSTCPTVPR